MRPELTIIVNMYKYAKFLNLCLDSLQNQTFKNFEIIVADDGSGKSVKKVVDYFREKLHITHIWQEDKGFRKCLIQNKAVLLSRADKLFFIDGDIVFHPFAVERVLKRLKDGIFITSRVVRLSKKITQKILRGDFDAKKIFSPYFTLALFRDWLFNIGKPKHLRTRFLQFGIYIPQPFVRIVQKFKKHKKTAGGCWAVYKRYFEAINGFDNTYVEYGHEDFDVYWRMHWLGVKSEIATNEIIGYHLWHPKRIYGKENKKKQIMARLKQKPECENGLRQIKKEEITILK
ncbi:MAG: glycosyltransferase [Elusimicrobia bacterium]|nr:glycosyltransferase [Elusimicrobiota bacterium]